VPAIETVRTAVVVPDLPEDIPAVTHLIRQLAQEVLDPWNLELPSQDRSA
jgi:hypothetical protein